MLSRQGPPGSDEPAQLEILQDDPDEASPRRGGRRGMATATWSSPTRSRTAGRLRSTARPGPRSVDADHAGVAVFVRTGHHEVALSYRPPGLKLGAAISTISLLLLLGIGGLNGNGSGGLASPSGSARPGGGPAGAASPSPLPRAMKDIPRAVWLITAVFGPMLLLSYSVLFPIYRAPDEVNHVDMIWGIRNERRYPNFDTRTFSAEVFASRSIAAGSTKCPVPPPRLRGDPPRAAAHVRPAGSVRADDVPKPGRAAPAAVLRDARGAPVRDAVRAGGPRLVVRSGGRGSSGS